MNSIPPGDKKNSNSSTNESGTTIQNSLIPNLISPAMPLLTQVYGDLLSPGVKKVGEALETVLDLSNTLLMPLKLKNEKTKINFQDNLNSYKKKVEEIEEENIVRVPPELGIPILDKLTYIENKDIAELFVNLLASASSRETCSLSHPAFINIITNLSVDEAKILQYISGEDESFIPFIKIKGKLTTGDAVELTDRLTGIENELDLLFPGNIEMYFSNLAGLGLINFQDRKYLTGSDSYVDLENFYDELKKNLEEKLIHSQMDDTMFESIVIQKGIFEVTNFAKLFFQACIKKTN